MVIHNLGPLVLIRSIVSWQGCWGDELEGVFDSSATIDVSVAVWVLTFVRALSAVGCCGDEVDGMFDSSASFDVSVGVWVFTFFRALS